jgi:ribosomal protein S18 acetylase RimI-like enzyme
MPDLNLIFGRLESHHDRTDFASGSEELDAYLKRVASQDDRRNVARLFVATEANARRIAGFYTLSSFAIGIESLPQALTAKLPAYREVPAALIGRLARHLAYRGKGVGDLLLVDALRRLTSAGRTLAVHLVVVDAKNEAAKAFYLQYGFVPLDAHPRRLVLPMATAAKLFKD